METISKKLKGKAEKLSFEWGNTCFIVLNQDGSLEAIVWNHYKWENPKREYVATVNYDGWEVKKGYKLES